MYTYILTCQSNVLRKVFDFPHQKAIREISEQCRKATGKYFWIGEMENKHKIVMKELKNEIVKVQIITNFITLTHILYNVEFGTHGLV